jgi:hypothetical protein
MDQFRGACHHGNVRVKTLFNLNPLIKLDGYYLLSDYLDIQTCVRSHSRP